MAARNTQVIQQAQPQYHTKNQEVPVNSGTSMEDMFKAFMNQTQQFMSQTQQFQQETRTSVQDPRDQVGQLATTVGRSLSQTVENVSAITLRCGAEDQQQEKSIQSKSDNSEIGSSDVLKHKFPPLFAYEPKLPFPQVLTRNWKVG